MILAMRKSRRLALLASQSALWAARLGLRSCLTAIFNRKYLKIPDDPSETAVKRVPASSQEVSQAAKRHVVVAPRS